MYAAYEQMARQRILDLHREAEAYRLSRQPRADIRQERDRTPLLHRLLRRPAAVA